MASGWFSPRLRTSGWFGRLDVREMFDERFAGATISASTQAGFVSALGLGALRRLGSVPSGGGFVVAWARAANVLLNARRRGTE